MLLLAAPASAQLAAPGGGGDEPIQITADAVEYDQDLDVFTARGNVRIEQEDLVLLADWVALNNTTRNGLASGNVEVQDEGDILYAEFLQFNLDTSKGVVYDGQLQAETGYRVLGSEVRRTSLQTYEFEDPVFTTCNCPEEGSRDPWAVKAKSADLEVGGYAVTRNTTVNVLGVPVLWTPYAVVPVKNERQTGFLFPVFSNSSRRGWEFGLPFFWAAHPQVGVQLTPYYTTDRGPYLRSELEYLLGPEGSRDYGELAFDIIPNDQVVDDAEDFVPFDPFRWGVRFRHQQVLPWGLDAKVWANMASDNSQPFDFPLLNEFRRNRYMESNASLTKRFGEGRTLGFSPWGAYAAVKWADDLQAPDDQDRDDFLLQRLPEAQVSQLASFLPFADRVLTSFDVKYAHFWRENDPADVLPGSTRVDDAFLDTGIDALPDGLERNDNGQIVTLDGRILSQDGTVTTAADILAAQLAMNPEADPEQILMEIMPLFDPDQSGDNAPLGPENDGLFQEGEPKADRGHRIQVNPRVAVPFRLGDAAEVYPELGYHGTFYQSDLNGFSHRSLITGRLDLRTRLRKISDAPVLGRIDHLVEPFLTYYGFVDVSSDDLPLFTPQPLVEQTRVRQLELFNVLRDSADRIPIAHGLVAGVSNRIYSVEPEVAPAAEEIPEDQLRRGIFGSPSADEERDQDVARDVALAAGAVALEDDVWVPNRLIADITTSLEYRSSDASVGWFVLDGIFYPTESTRFGLNFGWDLDEMQLEETKLEFGWNTLSGHSVGVRYRYLRQIPRFFEDFANRDERFEEFDTGLNEINQLGLFTRVALTPQWALLFSFRYSFDQDIVLTNQYGVEYISKCRCWAVQLTVEDDRAGGIEWRLRYALLGFGDDRGSPF